MSQFIIVFGPTARTIEAASLSEADAEAIARAERHGYQAHEMTEENVWAAPHTEQLAEQLGLQPYEPLPVWLENHARG